jgi:hypothetical protein
VNAAGTSGFCPGTLTGTFVLLLVRLGRFRREGWFEEANKIKHFNMGPRGGVVTQRSAKPLPLKLCHRRNLARRAVSSIFSHANSIFCAAFCATARVAGTIARSWPRCRSTLIGGANLPRRHSNAEMRTGSTPAKVEPANLIQ